MSKLEKLRKKLKDLSLDAVFIYDELNQRYLSSFAFTDGYLLVTLNNAYLVTDFRYYEMALKTAEPEFSVVIPSDRKAFTLEALKKDQCKSVGFEGNTVPFAKYKLLAEVYRDFEFIDIGDTIETIRQIKTKNELEKIQMAQNITDKAFLHILNVLNPNMTELEVAVELEYAMRKEGAEGFAFDTIAVSGDSSALPHGTPRNQKLKSGFLTMDFGAKLDGYCSDMTRTVVIGKADTDMRKLYNTVLKAQAEALNFIKAGVDCADADKIARDIINKDYNGAFGHSLGHSVGLFIHESPNLSARAKGRVLRIGETVTVEPGIYIFGKYGCRIEDMVAVEESGIYNFTHSTKELIEIL